MRNLFTRRNTIFTVLVFLSTSLLGACSMAERVRNANDVALTNFHHFNIETLVQAEVERQRIRQFRCYNPLLYPAALVAASQDQRLGQPWVQELLGDCPQFADLVADIAEENKAKVASTRISQE